MIARRAAAFALFALWVAALAEWARPELYLQRVSPLCLASALAANLLLAALAAWGLCVAARHPRGRIALATAFWLALAGSCYAVLRQFVPELGSVPRSIKIAILFVIALLAFTVALRQSDRLFERSARAVIAATLVWTLAPTLLAATLAREVAWPPQGTALRSEGPVVFLLLDEMSSSAATPLNNALTDLGWQVSSTPMRAAGVDTLDAIPAMFLSSAFPEARPCGVTSICSGTRVLDFAQVRASRDDIDVIGMYHPYCAMRGLRSCVGMEGPATYRSAWRQLANLYTARLGFRIASEEVGVAEARAKTSEIRDQQLSSVLKAPFWELGGALYAHLPVPHPLALAPDRRLDTEYAANIETAAAFVRQLAIALTERFGDQATLVITSDHPLRPAIWCSDSGASPYGSSGCSGLRKEFLDRAVPLMLASRRPLATPSLVSSLDAFRLLAR